MALDEKNYNAALKYGAINRPTLGAPSTLTVTATLTAAQMLSGLLLANQGAAGAATYTTPTGTAIDAAASPQMKVGETFELAIVNISTVDAEDVTLAAGVGVTLNGNLIVNANSAGTLQSSGVFVFRKTAANTFVGYRK